MGPKNRKSTARQKQRLARTKKPGATAGRSVEPAPKQAFAQRAAREDLAMAEALWTNHRYGEAIRLYEQASARQPGDATFMLALAQAYGSRHDYPKCWPVLQRVDALNPGDPQVQSALGELYVKFKNFPAAQACYRKVVESGTNRERKVRAQVALAKIAERLHRLDDALDAAEQALHAWPQHPYANLTAAKIRRRLGETEAAMEGFEALTRQDNIAPQVIAAAWYEIASARDKAADYDAAFEAFQKAKEAYAESGRARWPAARKIADNNTRMLRSITPEHFDRWHEQMPPEAEQQKIAWLVGHPRSGTTLIEQVLDSHEGLISADETSVLAGAAYPQLAKQAAGKSSLAGISLALPAMLDRATPAQLRDARKEYLLQTEGAIGEPIGKRIVLDKNPELTLLLPVITRMFPESRILLALRDPRDVVMSCFMQPLEMNPVSIHFLTLEDTAKKYATMLGGWLKMRDMIRCDWLEVKYEDSVNDLEAQARRVLAFLDLPWDENVLNYHQRSREKHVHSPTYEAVTKPVYKTAIGRWKNYEKHFGQALETLAPFIEKLGYDA